MDKGGLRTSGITPEEGKAGLPAVAIITGAGETTAASWAPVRRRLGLTIRVLAYRRRGISGVTRPRSLDAYLAELESAFAGESRPFVIVGHSFGGLLAQAYAERRPDRLAGLLLVDPTPAAVAHNRAVAAGFAVSAVLAGALKAVAPTRTLGFLFRIRALPLYPEQRRFERFATAEELRDWKAAVEEDMRGSAADELRSVLPSARAATELLVSPTAHDLPVGLVTSKAYGAKWVAMQNSIAKHYRVSRHHDTGDRFHNIHMAHPDLVASAIQDIARAAAGRLT